MAHREQSERRKKKKKEMPAFHKFHGKIKYHSKKKTVAVWLRINDRLLGSGFSAWTVTVMTKCNSMETLKMDRKIKRNNTGLLQVWGGCLGGGGVYRHVCKNGKIKQKAGYQRHVFHCSNQAVRQ